MAPPISRNPLCAGELSLIHSKSADRRLTRTSLSRSRCDQVNFLDAERRFTEGIEGWLCRESQRRAQNVATRSKDSLNISTPDRLLPQGLEGSPAMLVLLEQLVVDCADGRLDPAARPASHPPR